MTNILNSYINFDSTQYAQVPIGATRNATKGNGTNLYGTIPTWTATNWEIEFDVVFPTTTVESIKVFFDSDDANNRAFFYLSATGALRFSGATTMYVDGVATADNSVNHPLDGAVHHVKIVGTGTVKVGQVFRKYDATYYISSSMFNLRLTDLDTPANSRFYPLDSAYPSYTTTRQVIASDSMSAPITPSAITLEGSWINEGGGVYSRPWGTDGSALRFNLPSSIGKTYLFTFDLERVQGTSVKLMNDSTVYVNGATGSYSVLITPSEHTSSQEIRFARYSGVDGWGGKVKNLVIREVYNAGLWYNRTSGNVVTVYPDAIKPGEEFYFAIKYKVTDVSKNSGYNNPFSIGRRASGAYSCISLYLPESNGRFCVDPYNGLSRTTGSGIMGKDFGETHLDGLTHIAVVRLKTDGSYEFWTDSDTPKYTGVPNSQLAYAMDVINLNGYANATTGSVSRMGINFHYVYLYSALSAGDITALMQGENPESVGTIRQGYRFAGTASEYNGGTSLTTYNTPTYGLTALDTTGLDGTVADILYAALTNMGYTGSMADMKAEHFSGAGYKALTDNLYEALKAAGWKGSVADMKYEYFRSLS